MKPIPFENATFIKSLLPKESFTPMRNSHGADLDEIAFVGKSNVGKSSLINSLLRKKALAKVSAVPGKTQLINFFNIDDMICLVDLPGYGFAKVPKHLKDNWSESLDLYVRTRTNLKLLLLLLDIRRDASDEDLSLIKWADTYQKPFCIVFTKTDKLTQAQLQSQISKNVALIRQVTGKDVVYIAHTIQSSKCRLDLIKMIHQCLHT